MSPDQLADLMGRVDEIEERLRTLENRVFGGSQYTPPVGPVGHTWPLALPRRQLGRARNLTSITSLPVPLIPRASK